MKNYILILSMIWLCASKATSQKYFISFSDKNNSDYSISEPEAFLSTKAIEHRNQQNISIDITDLPVNTSYLDSLKKMEVTVGNVSKWLNGAIIECHNQNLIDTITKVSFISDCRLIYKDGTKSLKNKFLSPTVKAASENSEYSDIYGVAWTQTKTINAQYVHNYYNGEGITIAVLDAGFYHVNTLPCFEHLWNNHQIIEYKDFVNPESNFFSQHDHGMKVLSILGGYEENLFRGSAVGASYYLYRTEDALSEYPIEEYNWVCAAERADSLGADIITSSLGYSTFDDSGMNYSYANMDGKTTTIVKGAEIAFSKGIIVVNSAGNEGSGFWKYIISPADGENVLTVGAITQDSTVIDFSSYGPTSDGRIKPDLAAVGVGTGIQMIDGSYGTGNGTSFSAPVISGMVACTWQANPDMSNTEIIELIKTNAHLYNTPNNRMGYGIPDFAQSLNINNSVETHADTRPVFSTLNNPFDNQIQFTTSENIEADVKISLYNITGNRIFHRTYKPDEKLLIPNLNHLNKGIFIAELQYQHQIQIIKLIKQ